MISFGISDCRNMSRIWNGLAGKGLAPLEHLGTVAIVGVGLIGGSIGLALRARGLAGRVVGIGRNEATLAEARRLGAIDTATTVTASLAAVVALIVVAEVFVFAVVVQVVDRVLPAARTQRSGPLRGHRSGRDGPAAAGRCAEDLAGDDLLAVEGADLHDGGHVVRDAPVR